MARDCLSSAASTSTAKPLILQIKLDCSKIIARVQVNNIKSFVSLMNQPTCKAIGLGIVVKPMSKTNNQTALKLPFRVYNFHCCQNWKCLLFRQLYISAKEFTMKILFRCLSQAILSDVSAFVRTKYEILEITSNTSVAYPNKYKVSEQVMCQLVTIDEKCVCPECRAWYFK